jgi:hypothetical protein
VWFISCSKQLFSGLGESGAGVGSDYSVNDCALIFLEGCTVLLVALFALSATLWGAASFVSPGVLAVACAVTGCWLLVFAVREWTARGGRRSRTAVREG